MEMRLIRIPHDKNVRCPFCGEKPEYVWSSKVVAGFYKSEILHHCDGDVKIHVHAFGKSRADATGSCIAKWTRRAD